MSRSAPVRRPDGGTLKTSAPNDPNAMVRQRDIKTAITEVLKAGLAVKQIKLDADGSATIEMVGGPGDALDDEVAALDEAIRKSRGTRR